MTYMRIVSVRLLRIRAGCRKAYARFTLHIFCRIEIITQKTRRWASLPRNRNAAEVAGLEKVFNPRILSKRCGRSMIGLNTFGPHDRHWWQKRENKSEISRLSFVSLPPQKRTTISPKGRASNKTGRLAKPGKACRLHDLFRSEKSCRMIGVCGL
jgi:hypothetical protein